MITFSSDNDLLVIALYEYMLRVQDDLEVDLLQTRNNALRYVDADNVDLVYWLEGNARLQTAREIFADISRIIKMYRFSRLPP